MARTLGIQDLQRVFIRAQDDTGKWDSLSVDMVSSKQFDIWARSRADILDETDTLIKDWAQEDTEWTLEERAEFCNWLWQQGALHLLKDDSEG